MNVVMVSKGTINRELIQRIKEAIPPLPHIIKNIVNFTYYEEVSVDKLAEEITKEPELAGEILKFINSNVFSLVRVNSLQHAIVVLGTYNIARMSIAFWVKKLMGEKILEGYLQRKNELAIQSFVGAYATKRLCSLIAPALEYTAFTASALRNVGKMISDSYVFLTRKDIVSEMFKGKSLVEAEESIFGISFPEINYIVAESWGLGDELRIPIRYFKRPETLPPDVSTDIKLITYAVHLGDIVAQMSGIGASFDNIIDRFSRNTFIVLKIDETTIENLLAELCARADLILSEFFGAELKEIGK